MRLILVALGERMFVWDPLENERIECNLKELKKEGKRKVYG